MTFITFIALFLIAAGIGYLIKHIFNVDLPMPRYLTGVFIVLVGLHFLIVQLEDEKNNESKWVWFTHSNFAHHITGENEYAVVFGESTIDLSETTLSDSLPKVNISVAFGHAEVYLPDSIPYRIINNIAFGSTNGNGPNNSGLGDFASESDNFDPKRNYLIIEADVAFGGLTWR
ncbi:putative membrane protein [Salinivirga cyanobacteriivorans]|uniref:Putative membrane protein n=1 Tax=Salinivirga cyanobacteriivorans TaxID=1307839 RepID=A0A0S2HYY4_9BACT|nr:LiaF domain-containing protein [Salinivirga cyanobacteriivorans]ALO15299.1 putative membrane protein [Salinivirga cyanobacteriivorans]